MYTCTVCTRHITTFPQADLHEYVTGHYVDQGVAGNE